MLSASPPTETNSKRIDRLFLKFSVFYGQVWRSQFKNEEFLAFAKKEWARVLVGVSDAHFEQAIKNYCAEKEYPPSLTQFMDFCKTLQKREELLTKRPKIESVSKPEIALYHLKQIKQLLQR